MQRFAGGPVSTLLVSPVLCAMVYVMLQTCVGLLSSMLIITAALAAITAGGLCCAEC